VRWQRESISFMGLAGAKGELSNIIEIMENAKKKKEK